MLLLLTKNNKRRSKPFNLFNVLGMAHALTDDMKKQLRVVITGQLLKETVETQFSVSNFPNGLYFITVQTEQGAYLCRLIKQ